MKRVCKMREVIPPSSSKASAAVEEEEEELCCLSGDKPFFEFVISKSHVKSVFVPAHMIPTFPCVDSTVILTRGGKRWDLKYKGKDKRPRFDCVGWRSFVADNNVKCGDACIFEVMESSVKVARLRVHILRQINHLPPELDDGNTRNTPIVLDD